ncbi:MAG: hypothetical protein ACPG4T_06735 [Nannocystaceae bacterium]
MNSLLVAGALLMLAPAPKPTPAQPAPATDADADSRARANARTNAAGTTILDFENDNVDGKVLSPTGTTIPGQTGKTFKSLIQIRGTFTPELIKMSFDV